jgi:hypothetical protein
MKRKDYLIISIIGAVITVGICVFWIEIDSLENLHTGFFQSRAPQSGNFSPTQVWNKAYNDTEGALQGYVVGRGATSPQSGAFSEAQVLNKAYNDTEGGFQLYLSSNSSDIAFINTTSLTEGDLLYYDATGTEWDNTQGQLTLSGIGSSPTITLENPTAEDTDHGRESTIIVKGLQSGAEESTLGKIEVSHYGSSDDQKGQIVFYANDGNDNDSPQEVVSMVMTTSGGRLLFPSQGKITFSGGSNFSENGSGEFVVESNNALRVYTYSGGWQERVTIEDTGEMKALYGLVPAHKGLDPCGSGFPQGAIFWNTSSLIPCYCNGTDDLKMSDNSACF